MAVHWLPLDEGVTSLPPRIDASVMAAPGLCRSLLARALMDWWMPIISPVPCFGSWLCADCPLVKVSPLWTTVAEGLTCPSIVLLFKFYIDIQISLEAPPPPPGPLLPNYSSPLSAAGCALSHLPIQPLVWSCTVRTPVQHQLSKGTQKRICKNHYSEKVWLLKLRYVLWKIGKNSNFTRNWPSFILFVGNINKFIITSS